MKRLIVSLLARYAVPLCPRHVPNWQTQSPRTPRPALGALLNHFHRNPDSPSWGKTAARLATELRQAGFEVIEGDSGSGVVAIMKNGPGSLK